MSLEVAPVDRELAESAAELKNEHGLGLADACAAALARSKKAELVTATPNSSRWKRKSKSTS